MQQLEWTAHGTLRLAAADPTTGCFVIESSSARFSTPALDANGTVRIGSCKGAVQRWEIVGNKNGPKGTTEYAIQIAGPAPLCLRIGNGGGRMVDCDDHRAETNWVAQGARPGSKPFSMATTDHDDAICLTVIGGADDDDLENGAFTFADDKKKPIATSEGYHVLNKGNKA